MRVLITGGAGYIGSVLVPILLECGDRVTVIDNFMHGVNSLASCCEDDLFDVVRGDVRDMEVMKPLVAKADLVIPLAAIVGAPACDADATAAYTPNEDRGGAGGPGPQKLCVSAPGHGVWRVPAHEAGSSR